MFMYPRAKRDEDHFNNYHGEKIADPYHWLEDPDNEDTEEFITLQNEVTNDYVKQVSKYPAIHKRLREVWNYPKFGCPLKKGNRYFFSYNSGLQNQNVIQMQNKPESEPILCLDPNTLMEGILKVTSISENGKYFCYGMSPASSDWVTLRTKHIETHDLFPETLTKIKFSNISWTHDNRGFFYECYPYADCIDEAENEQQYVCYHILGCPQSEDFKCVHFDNPNLFLGSEVSTCGKFLIISVYEKSNSNFIYFSDISRPDHCIRPNMDIQLLVTSHDSKHEYIANTKDYFTLLTNENAENNKIINIDIHNIDYKSASIDLVPEKEYILEWALCADKDKLILCYLRNVRHVLLCYDLRTGMKLHDFDLDIGSITRYSGNLKHSEFFIHFHSFLAPGIVYRCDLSSEKPYELKEFKKTVIEQFDPSKFVVEQMHYFGMDNCRVPMYVIHKRDMLRNGKSPCMLFGYGGFGNSVLPAFSAARLFFMLHFDGLSVIANIRGGGEFGKQWHEDGILDKKNNSFEDFQAAANFLVWNSFTSYEKLIIQGAANGGLLVAACMNQVPEKFGCAIIHVGVLDMLKFHKFTIGHTWISDYGNPDDKKNYIILKDYSPLHNIRKPFRPDTQYPAVLLLTPEKDSRVVPLHSLKFIAELQHSIGSLNVQTRPLMIRVDTESGGKIKRPMDRLIGEYTDIFCFIMKSLNLAILNL